MNGSNGSLKDGTTKIENMDKEYISVFRMIIDNRNPW